MTDLSTSRPDSEVDTTEAPGGAARLPIWLRLAGAVGLAALLVALYAVVQLFSSDGPQGPAGFPVSGEAPRVGAVAPDIMVPTFDGGTFSLSRHLADDGRPVFINMWAEWCIQCRTEMPAIDAAFREHPEVHFIGIVVRDKEAPARSFVAEYGITYQIGIDESGDVRNDYQVWAMPSTYLIGSDGTVIDRIFGPMTPGQLEEILAAAVTPDS